MSASTTIHTEMRAEGRHQIFGELQFVRDAALPDHDHDESESPKGTDDALVPPTIARELGDPERTVSSWNQSAATRVPVPEAAVDEHRPSLGAVCDIWRPREVGVPRAIARTQSVEHTANP
jgi:hypothetical protein